VNIEELMPSKDYARLNFPDVKYLNFPEAGSFTDLLKFKKVKISKEDGGFIFHKKVIIPSEIGLAEIILKNYQKIEEFEFAQHILCDTSYEIAKEIFDKDYSMQDKIKLIKTMLSAFGWGIPIIKKEKNKIIFDFIYPPYNKNPPLFRASILNGYLNYIFNTKFYLGKIDNSKMVFYLLH
jgi:hypothetical protein